MEIQGWLAPHTKQLQVQTLVLRAGTAKGELSGRNATQYMVRLFPSVPGFLGYRA